MPSTPSGYVLPPEYYAVPGTTIRSNQHNAPLEDLAQGVNDSFARNGSRPATGNLPMNGRKITGLAAGTAPNDAARVDQIPAISEWQKSVSSLTMQADRVPYATGATTSALAILTGFGRSMIAAIDAAAARLTLGLGALAVKNKADIADIDTTGAASATTFLRGDGAWAGVAGVDQEWEDVTAVRNINIPYRNETGRPITFCFRGTNDAQVQVSKDGSSWVTLTRGMADGWVTGSFLIPHDHYYRVVGGSKSNWTELR